MVVKHSDAGARERLRPDAPSLGVGWMRENRKVWASKGPGEIIPGAEIGLPKEH
jgi:hypothetical protein